MSHQLLNRVQVLRTHGYGAMTMRREIKHILKSNLADNRTHRHDRLLGYVSWPEAAQLSIRYKNWGQQIGEALKGDDESALINVLEEMQDHRIDSIRTWRSGVWSNLESKHNFYDIRTCDHCSRVCHEDDMTTSEYHSETVCSDCLSRNYVYSEIMADYIHESEARRYYPTARSWHSDNGDWAIARSTSMSESIEHQGDLFSHDAYGDLGFGHNEDDDDDDDDSNDTIGDYHSSKRIVGHIPSAYDKRTPAVLLGLELEMEVDDGESRSTYASKVKGLLNRDHSRYCAAESDGSLDYGFEIVTGWTGLDVHAQVLKALDGVSFDGNLSSHDTTTCGLHVHVDKADMTPFHASKMIAFIHDPDNKALVKCVARRYGDRNSRGNSYAKFDHGKDKGKGDGLRAMQREKSYRESEYTKEQSRRAGLRSLNEDRYEALNFQNERTVEFRLFRGTLKYDTIMACLEFAYATWFFCRDAGMGDLTDAAFCEFIARPENRPDTKFLRRYLKLRNHQPMLDVDDKKDKAEDSASCETEYVTMSEATPEAIVAAAKAKVEREAAEVAERAERAAAKARREAEQAAMLLRHEQQMAARLAEMSERRALEEAEMERRAREYGSGVSSQAVHDEIQLTRSSQVGSSALEREFMTVGSSAVTAMDVFNSRVMARVHRDTWSGPFGWPFNGTTVTARSAAVIPPAEWVNLEVETGRWIPAIED